MITVKVVSIAFFLIHSPSCINSHAVLTTPAGRQWYSFKEGKTVYNGEIANEYPVKRSGPYGYQAGGETYGACGRSRFDDDVEDFTWNYVTAFGDPVPWKTQAIYEEGQDIFVEVEVLANHKGHFEMSLCLDWDNPTQACFDENPLLFVDDVYNGAPVDPDYPYRGYMAPAGVPGEVKANNDYQLIGHRYQLPTGISGERVLLQWHWVSALGCKAEGYQNYAWPSHWGENGSGTTCVNPLPDYGNDPQQYWNCAEISILPSAPSSPTPTLSASPTAITTTAKPSYSSNPTNLPTPTPTYSPTHTKAPSTEGCCSGNYKDCVDWCGFDITQSECEACPNDVVWIPGGPLTGCEAKDFLCPNNNCCPGLACVDMSGNGNDFRCRVSTASETTSPFSSPTFEPTVEPVQMCCSTDYAQCDHVGSEWCQEQQSNCEGPCSAKWIDRDLVVSTGCIPRWQECTDDPLGCCLPGSCSEGTGLKRWCL